MGYKAYLCGSSEDVDVLRESLPEGAEVVDVSPHSRWAFEDMGKPCYAVLVKADAAGFGTPYVDQDTVDCRLKDDKLRFRGMLNGMPLFWTDKLPGMGAAETVTLADIAECIDAEKAIAESHWKSYAESLETRLKEKYGDDVKVTFEDAVPIDPLAVPLSEWSTVEWKPEADPLKGWKVSDELVGVFAKLYKFQEDKKEIAKVVLDASGLVQDADGTIRKKTWREKESML